MRLVEPGDRSDQPRSQLEHGGPVARGHRVGIHRIRRPQTLRTHARRRRPAAIDQDPEQPGTELLALLIPTERAIGSQQGFLHHVLRLHPVAEHVRRVA